MQSIQQGFYLFIYLFKTIPLFAFAFAVKNFYMEKQTNHFTVFYEVLR